MLDLLPDTEQQALADSVAAFLASEMPLERLRPKPGSIRPELRDRWKDFAELGCFSIGLPESNGGLGLSVAEEMLVFRECGRFLVSPAVPAAAIAARIAARAGKNDLCEEIVEGKCRVALAERADYGATPLKGRYFLIDPQQARVALLIEDGRAQLLETSAFSDASDVDPLDEAIRMQRGRLDQPRALVSAADSDPVFALEASVLVSALLVGAAEGARDLAVEYVKVREQFGQVIGGFQAIKHKCADLAVRAEAALSQTTFAALALRIGRGDAPFQVAAARLIAGRGAIDNAEEGIQIHGGVGFTAECDAHHYVKRAQLLEKLCGGTRAARRMLLDAPAPE